MVERTCPHGVGHPDPDSVRYLDERGPKNSRGYWGVHGCDGCCAKLTRPAQVLRRAAPPDGISWKEARNAVLDASDGNYGVVLAPACEVVSSQELRRVKLVAAAIAARAAPRRRGRVVVHMQSLHHWGSVCKCRGVDWRLPSNKRKLAEDVRQVSCKNCLRRLGL